MQPFTKPPGWFISFITLGIKRALWIAEANRKLQRGGAGFWFAWFLQPFANYGLAKRFNEALAQVGSSHRVSPFWCFWLTGFPIIGARKRLKKAVFALNDANGVRSYAAAQQQSAASTATG